MLLKRGDVLHSMRSEKEQGCTVPDEVHHAQDHFAVFEKRRHPHKYVHDAKMRAGRLLQRQCRFQTPPG
jgi:hypothetical protein